MVNNLLRKYTRSEVVLHSLAKVVVSVILMFTLTLGTYASGDNTDARLDMKEIFSSSVDSFMVSYINLDQNKITFWRDAAYRSVCDSDTYNGYKIVDFYVNLVVGSVVGRGGEIDELVNYFSSREDTFGIKMKSMAYCLKGNFLLITDYEKAIEYYDKAGETADNIGKRLYRVYDMLLMSEAYLRAGRNVDAAYYSRQILEDDICKEPSVLRFLTQAQLYKIYSQMRNNAVVEQYGEMIEKEGFYLTNIALESRYLLRKADYLFSIDRLQEAYDDCTSRLLQTCELSGTGMEVWRVNLQAAKVLSALGRYKEAERHVEKCKKMEYYVQGFKFTRLYSSYHVDLVEAWVKYGENKTDQARDILRRSNPPQEVLNQYDFGVSYYRLMELIYSRVGDYRNAVKMVEASKNLRENSIAENAIQRSRDLDNIYRSDTTIINQDIMLMRKNQDVTLAQRRIVLWILSSVVLAAVVILVRLLIIRYKKRKSAAKDIEHKEKLEKEVRRQTELLTTQKNEISKKNQDIMMSQSYARVIQEGVLPDPAELNYDEIGGSFVIYKPVDVVSGDFYWFRRFGNHLVMCCADCSGQGVPGAMMTMVGLTLLNEITTSSTTFVASQLLENLDKALLDMMPDIRRSDSMDVTIAVIDLVNYRLDVSTANQDFIISQNGELKVYSGVKRRVGFASMRDIVEPFDDKMFDLKKGDAIYIFTDGVSALSGGMSGENLTSDGLVKILSGCSHVDVNSRSGSINKALVDWCSGNAPGDDYSIVCVEI